MDDLTAQEDVPRILICEDEVMLATELARSLKSLGYEVTAEARSGEEAVRLVEENKPDLILMDIKLEGEIGGIESAEQIRNRFDIRSFTLLDTQRKMSWKERSGRSLTAI